MMSTSESDRRLIKSTRFARIYVEGPYVIKSIARDFAVPPHNHRAELAILERLSKLVNPSIIKLIKSEIVGDELELTFPHYKCDLQDFMRRCYKLSDIAKKRSNPYYSLPSSSLCSHKGPFKNRFDVDSHAFHFTCQLAQGLQFLHQQGIIHRDIKPQNILVHHPSPNNLRLIITDFGISYDNHNQAQMRDEPPEDKITDVSTSIYKAPELLFGVKNYSYAVDIWALMVIISQWFQEEAQNPARHIPAMFDDGSGKLNDGETGSDIKLVVSIFNELGIPALKDWPQVSEFGSSDAFTGMFGTMGDGLYILDQKPEFIATKFDSLLPRLKLISNVDQRTALRDCVVGMASFESTKRWDSNKIVQRLLS